MLRPPDSQSLLLYLDWIVSGLVLAITAVLSTIDANPQFPFRAIVCIVGLIVIGVISRKKNLHKSPHKLWFTLAEFGLILLPPLVGEPIPIQPLVGMVLIIRSANRFNLKSRLAVAGGIYLSFILTIFLWDGPLATSFSQALNPAHYIVANPFNILILKLTAALHYAMLLLIQFLLVNTLFMESQSREHLSVTLTQLRQYSLRIEDQAALQERNRIAREIHDALGHTLIAQSVQLDSGLLLLNNAKLERADTFFNTSKSLCTQALKEVRQSVEMLRSDCLSGKSLEAAIAALIKDFQTTTAITPDWAIHVSQPLPSELRSTVYRIVQAALTNITRHSAATEVTLRLNTYNKMLYLSIVDNGQGFNPAQNSTGFGLQGMRERALALDGQFNLVSEPGAGCLITVQIPLPRSTP